MNSCHDEGVRDRNRAGIEAVMTHLWASISMDSTSSLGGMLLLLPSLEPHRIFSHPLQYMFPSFRLSIFPSMPIPARFQLDSGREHPPRDMNWPLVGGIELGLKLESCPATALGCFWQGLGIALDRVIDSLAPAKSCRDFFLAQYEELLSIIDNAERNVRSRRPYLSKKSYRTGLVGVVVVYVSRSPGLSGTYTTITTGLGRVRHPGKGQFLSNIIPWAQEGAIAMHAAIPSNFNQFL
eukprot:gene1513-biopygen1206